MAYCCARLYSSHLSIVIEPSGRFYRRASFIGPTSGSAKCIFADSDLFTQQNARKSGAGKLADVHILTMNGDSYRLEQSARRRRAETKAEQNQATSEIIDPDIGEITSG